MKGLEAWLALHWGPKRWASSMHVCAKTRANELVPGAEDPIEYRFNPGEGWAETYRVLNELRLGVAEAPWQIISDSLYPDDAALGAAEQDVTTPWQTETTTTRTASLTPTTSAVTYTIATKLDGTLKVAVRSAAGLALALKIYAAARRVVHTVAGRAIARRTTICGARSYRIHVTATRGSGSFRLTVAEPQALRFAFTSGLSAPAPAWCVRQRPGPSELSMATITMAAMAALGVRSGSLPFDRPTRSRCKQDVSANASLVEVIEDVA